jgi:outer membrane protein TolC
MNKFRLKGTVLYFLFVFFIGILHNDVHSLTLEKVIAVAMQNNKKICQYNERVRQRSLEEKNAIGNLAPVVTLSAGYNYMDDPLTMSLDPIRDAMISLQARDQVQFASIQSQMKGGPAIDKPAATTYQAVYKAAYGALDNAIPHFIDTLKEQDYPTVTASVVQPLFMGGKIIAGIKAAHAEMVVSVSELEKAKNEVLEEIINYYLSTVFVHDVIQVRKDVLSAMEIHQQKAERLAEQGMIARYHLLRAEVAVSEAKRNLLNDLNRFDIACLALQKVINDSTFQIDSLQSLQFISVKDSLETFVNTSMKGQPVFEIIHGKQAMAREKVNAQIAGLLPQIAAFGKYEFFSDYLSALEPEWVVGVTATLPIFNGLKNVTSLQSSRSLVKELSYVENIMTNDIKLWVKKAYKEMRNNENRYNLLDSDYKLAEENLRQCKSRFENGYGTSLEVIDAQLVLEKNRIERLTAIYDYCKSMLELTMAGGNPEQFCMWFRWGI